MSEPLSVRQLKAHYRAFSRSDLERLLWKATITVAELQNKYVATLEYKIEQLGADIRRKRDIDD